MASYSGLGQFRIRLGLPSSPSFRCDRPGYQFRHQFGGMVLGTTLPMTASSPLPVFGSGP
jgi:hypothetical protein